MKKEKRTQRNKLRKQRSRRRTIMLLAIVDLFLVMMLVGTTTAFLTAKDDAVANIFRPSTVTSRVEESFDGTTKTSVTVSNTGNTEAYIRAAIVVTWKDEKNGSVYGAAPSSGDYTMELNLTDWFLGGDGYYYHKSPVASGENTAVLIRRCTANSDSAPEGYGLNVEILASAIQSVPISVVNEAWPAVNAAAAHGDLTKVN